MILETGKRVYWWPNGVNGIPIVTSIVDVAPSAKAVIVDGYPGWVSFDHVRPIVMDDNIVRIRKQLLLLFSTSIGSKFRVKGTELHDHIVHVDVDNEMVHGEEHTSVFVDLVELTGGKVEEQTQENL